MSEAPLVLPNLPATQAIHESIDVAPEPPNHLPKTQLLHCFFSVRPVALLYRPAGHESHVGGFVAPVVVVLYKPASHADDLQAGWPVWSVYSDPALQSKHDDMSVAPLVLPNLPALQGVQSVLAVFPVSPSHLPGMHLLHAADSDAPIAELNLP